MRDLPKDLADYYRSGGPLWLYNGNLQIRSLDAEPSWNSLSNFWTGDQALYKGYRSLQIEDVPFAQDCFGDQFFLRNGLVQKLQAESDDIEEIGFSFKEWLSWIKENPDENLNVDVSRQIQPGKLLFAFPPFCVNGGGTSKIKEIAVLEVIGVHMEIAAKIRDAVDGETIEFRFEPDPESDRT